MKKLLITFILAIVANIVFAQQTTPNAPGETVIRNKAFEKMPEHPLAPAEYRRPQDYVPTLYKMNLAQISEKYSADTIKRGRKAYNELLKVNENGKWKPNGKSIDEHKCPEWFEDLKFGIFIDWGLWSIASWAPKRENGAMYPDWYELRMYSNYTNKSHFWGFRNYHIKNWGEDFKRDHFIPLFQAKKFDAEKLIELFKDAGAKYVVPFNKHHSGFCLWDCSYSLRDTVDMGPRRDIVKEIVDACAKNSLKFGFYFSLTEWEYPVLDKDGKMQNFSWGQLKPYSSEMEYNASGKIAVNDYVKEYLIPQAMEFINKYSPDIMWYDGEWGVRAKELGCYELSAYYYNINEGKKEVAINDRYGIGEPDEIAGQFTKRKRNWLRTIRGDFFTDEFGDTSERIDPAKHHAWEACRGISQSYGNNWQDNATNVLSAKEFISMFVDMVARGGNLLLLVNLDGQGAIPEVQKQRLLDIGSWLKKYGKAIYSTRIVAPFATKEVAYTQSKDGKTVYAIIKNPKAKNVLKVSPKANSNIVEISKNKNLAWEKADGKIIVNLPEEFIVDNLPVAVEIQVK